MTINIGLVLCVCGFITSAAGAHYGDFVLACIGPAICVLSGYQMAVRSTITVTLIQRNGDTQ